MLGQIKTLKPEASWGFIKGDGRDYFFHSSDCNGQFNDIRNSYMNGENVTVEFDTVQSPKGPRAANLRRVELT